MASDDRTGEGAGAESAREALVARLDQVERLLAGGARLGRVSQNFVGGRSRWPVAVAVVVAIGLQLVLPDRFAAGHRAVPAFEMVLLIALVAANPLTDRRRARWLRRAMVVFTAIITGTNAWSAVRLVQQIVEGKQQDALILLTSGAAIWVTNVIVFGLWYWQFDRGGPLSRLAGAQPYPDFSFPQRQNPQEAPAGWEPAFIDYLYLSYTNATAFSPTDVMPFTGRAKFVMMVQSAVSLVTVALVIARAIGLFK
ncbi:hypothetical protein [Amycolatopsis sp. CA-230715]|uniref:hypothetical protein n=1 Tax=Amycolatopsis sp. CA-230715 TaxID=2745196 RepID=UPI001C3233D1|nr:hypothetical protein [Amycolatopsis sp. CA-230715]QWF78979.1 hypothetical protein HUW46_02379 [Amycolatopsis sp. CA-230715]